MRTRIVGVALLAFVCSVAFAAQADKYPTVSYKKAKNHIGEFVWVEGKVLKTEKESGGTTLCFNNNKKYIRVMIQSTHLANFEGSLKHKYVGKKIKAIGKVMQQGSFLILYVSEPKYIKVVEAAT